MSATALYLWPLVRMIVASCQDLFHDKNTHFSSNDKGEASKCCPAKGCFERGNFVENGAFCLPKNVPARQHLQCFIINHF
jgi:hypothetical protein